MKAKSRLCVAALMVAGLSASQAEAAPPSVLFISTTNVSGGADLSFPLYFNAPSSSSFFLQTGEMKLFGANPFLPSFGKYYHFPLSRTTLVTGTWTWSAIPGASVNFVAGQVGPGGNFFGTIIVQGFGSFDGAHVGAGGPPA